MCSPLSDSSLCFLGLRPVASRATRAHRPRSFRCPPRLTLCFPCFWASRPRCARPVLPASSSPDSLFFLEFWPLGQGIRQVGGDDDEDLVAFRGNGHRFAGEGVPQPFPDTPFGFQPHPILHSWNVGAHLAIEFGAIRLAHSLDEVVEEICEAIPVPPEPASPVRW
jgi:hypothetical protein